MSNNNSIMNWINQVRPVAFWILVVAIVYQAISAQLMHFVVFPMGILSPMRQISGGLITATFQGYVVLALITGFFLCYLGKLRAKDFALDSKKIMPAIGITLFVWLMIQLKPFLEGQGLQLQTDWMDPGVAMGRLSGFFMSEIFGNSLYEELFYRALLISQFALLFRKKCSNLWAFLFAVVCSSAIFSILHVPHRISSGIPFDDVMMYIVPAKFFGGLAFAVIFLLTKNIFVAVGIHALSNASPNIVLGTSQHFEHEFILILLVFFFIRWCYRKLSKTHKIDPAEDADGAGYKATVITLAVVCLLSDTILGLIYS